MMPFLMLRLFIQERERGDVKKNERSGQKASADDVGKPMYAREESSNDGDQSEGEADDGDGEVGEARFDEVLAGKGGCYKDTASQHGVRGGVRGFQDAINENGAIVDNEQLK